MNDTVLHLMFMVTGAAVTYGSLKISAALNTVKQPQPQPVKRLRRKLEPNESIVISTYAPNSKVVVNITVEHETVYRNNHGAPISDFYLIVDIKPEATFDKKYSMLVSHISKKDVIPKIMNLLNDHIKSKSDLEVIEGDIAYQFAHIDFNNAHYVILDRWVSN